MLLSIFDSIDSFEIGEDCWSTFGFFVKEVEGAVANALLGVIGDDKASQMILKEELLVLKNEK